MEKYHGYDLQFYHYLFARVIAEGGLRLQLIASDLGTPSPTSQRITESLLPQGPPEPLP